MAYGYSAGESTTYDQGLSLHDVLATQAKRTPDAIAIVAPRRTSLTYGRLCSHMGHVVQTLNAMGLGRNDRIAIVLPNGPEMAVAFLAIAAGATSAPLNPAYQANEFDFYLSDLHAKALLIQSGIDSPARAVAHKRGIPILECAPVLEAEAGLFTLRDDKRSRLAGANGRTLLPGFAQPDDVALVLHTSGTTARPKLVPLTHTNLCTSAHNMQMALALTAEDRCLNVMPLFHIHGLIGATLLPLVAGASVVCTPGFDVTTFFGWMEEFHPTWYTAVPTMHQAILTRAERNREIIARCPLRFIRSSSAALPPQVMAELERVFQAPVIESYGMTEASLQITSNPLPPRERKTGSVGVAAGPEIAMMDDMGHVLPPGQTGEIVIRGANVTQGYENNPTANASAFTHGWFKTGDQGFVDAEGYLFITGRLKEIINRGGEKISPREVDEVLMEHPAIAQVVTFAAPHALLGEEVAVAVVLREHASATERELQEFAETRLADFKVPRRVLILQDIPKGPTGKLQRIGLAEKLGLMTPEPARPTLARTFVAPRDTLECQLTQIWEKILAIKPIGVRDNFFDLGGHSLLAVRLIAQIEKILGKNLPAAILFQTPTIEQLASMLRQEKWPASWSSLLPIHPSGSKPPFFWIHGDSSNAFLPRYLGPEQPFYGLEHQSQDGKRARYTRVETIATHYLKAIRTVQPLGPYFLGGYSFGSRVAFEAAQQLKRQGEEVSLLVLLDPRSLTSGTSASSLIPSVINGLTNVTRFCDTIRRHLRTLASLGPQEKPAYVLVRVQGKIKASKILKKILCTVYVSTGYPLPPSLRSPYILAIYHHAAQDYIPQPYAGRVILFKGKTRAYDPLFDWQTLIVGELEMHEVPGEHLDMIKEPYIQFWAETLNTCLHKAQSRETF